MKKTNKLLEELIEEVRQLKEKVEQLSQPIIFPTNPTPMPPYEPWKPWRQPNTTSWPTTGWEIICKGNS